MHGNECESGAVPPKFPPSAKGAARSRLSRWETGHARAAQTSDRVSVRPRSGSSGVHAMWRGQRSTKPGGVWDKFIKGNKIMEATLKSSKTPADQLTTLTFHHSLSPRLPSNALLGIYCLQRLNNFHILMLTRQ